MQQKISRLMEEYQITFGELADKLNISKQTLTRKMNGSTDWTYQEMSVLSEILHIQDPMNFFYNKE
jgi:hypothetical protein